MIGDGSHALVGRALRATGEVLTALEQLRASPNESVMIGDNENDHAAPRAAGTAVILMRYGYLRVPPETLAPDAWLDQFANIPPALDRMNRKR